MSTSSTEMKPEAGSNASNVQPNVVVVGSFMMDLIVRTERIPKEGETVIGKEFRARPGVRGPTKRSRRPAWALVSPWSAG